MAILTERKAWRRPKTAAARPTEKLTAEEQANVRAALLYLRDRLGGWRKLAVAMGVTYDAISRRNKRGRTVSAAWAIRAARLLRAPVEDVLAGKWPPLWTCPTCGRA